MASTGIRVGAIKLLKLKHITKLQHESPIGLVSIYPDSKDHRYNALMTQECMASIDEYIDYRRKQHEKITDESYIIRDKFATFSKSTNRPQPLGEHAVNKQMKFLLRKAGLPFKQLQPDHSFRKFFNTCLMNSDVAHSFKELLVGHSVRLDDVYYDKDNETSRQKIIVEYMKAVDALTINEEYRLKKKIIEYEDKLKDAPKIGELESHLAAKILEQDALKNQVERLQIEKQNETQAMQQKYEQEMNAVREQMSQIMSMIQQNPTLAQVKPESLIKKKLDYKIKSRVNWVKIAHPANQDVEPYLLLVLVCPLSCISNPICISCLFSHGNITLLELELNVLICSYIIFHRLAYLTNKFLNSN